MYPPTTINLLMEQFHDAVRYCDAGVAACTRLDWSEAVRLFSLACDGIRLAHKAFVAAGADYAFCVALVDKIRCKYETLRHYAGNFRDRVGLTGSGDNAISIMNIEASEARELHSKLIRMIKAKG